MSLFDKAQSFINDGSQFEPNETNPYFGTSISDWLGRATNDAYNGVFGNLLFPGEVHDKEFAQQMYLQLYQNEWNSEAAKMARSKAAGISPYAAAGAIAGGDASSVSGPSSSAVGAGASSLGSLANAGIGIANAVTGGAASLAEAAFKTGTLQPTIENLTSEAAKNLADKGLTEQQIYAWQVDNKYRDQNAQADLRNKILTGDNLSKQYEVMHAQYELTTQQIDTELAKLSLMAAEENNQAAQAAYYQKLKEKTDYEAMWQKQRNDFWKQNGYDIMVSSTDAILVARLEAGLDNTEVIKTMSQYYGDRTNAEQSAITDNMFMQSYNRALGESIASWKSRPSSAFSFITDIANRIASDIREGRKSRDAAESELRGLREFKSSYEDYKKFLRDDISKKKSAYKRLKHGNNEAAAEAFRKYQNAVTLYEDFDENDFIQVLLSGQAQ